jgi:hypothetical protein
VILEDLLVFNLGDFFWRGNGGDEYNEQLAMNNKDGNSAGPMERPMTRSESRWVRLPASLRSQISDCKGDFEDEPYVIARTKDEAISPHRWLGI